MYTEPAVSGSNHTFQKNVITDIKYKMSKKIMSKIRDPVNKVPLVPEKKNPLDEPHCGYICFIL